ncbi:MAG: signal recognition particle-docking protein FtsY [Bacteroidetes bacterium]|nr:MAG: signal recognition particle-docking protein FtsY [Bacteroidota bacterium]
MGLFDIFSKKKLDTGLLRTREGFLSRLGKIVTGKTIVDDEVLDSLEETLITSDVGTETTMQIITNIQKRIEREKKLGTDRLNEILKEEISSLLIDNPFSDFALPPTPLLKERGAPYVILVVGVNGVGKTTTIGKLSHNFKKAGKNVMLGAADTFRAAAVEQLGIWAKRTDAQIISQGAGADPAAVAFDTVSSAVAKKMDVAIIDTAGRLHNKTNLMSELSKIKRVIQKVVPGAPHEVLLVLDASTGQNAIEQCKQFTEVTQVTALALTKLDGTAKGGVVIGISDKFKIPVKYIGVGEGIDDLQLFNKQQFVASLFHLTSE